MSVPSESATPAKSKPRFAALESRNFRLLWFGLLTGNVGTWMATTAEQWLVTDLYAEDAAFALGLISVSFALPMLLLPPVGGIVADRVPRLRVMWGAQIAYVTLALILVGLLLIDVVNLPILMAYALGQGIILAFDNPTRQALLPDLVPREALTSAVSMMSSVFTGAALIGPGVAGALIPLVGPAGVFAVRALLGVVALVALAQMRDVPDRPQRVRSDGTKVRTDGFSYVLRSPFMLTLLSLSLIAGLFGRSYGPMLAVFARDIFSVGSFWFGVMVSAPGIGTLAGSLWLASRADVSHKGRWIFWTTVGFSVCLLTFALLGNYAIGLALLVATGILSTVGSSLVTALVQLRAPHELRGRIMSLYTITLIGIPSFGALIVGSLAELTGVRVAVGGAAILAGLLTALAFAVNRELREV